MLTLFSKKKISENKIANIFVNGILDSVEKGFPEVAELINNDKEFVKSPNIGNDEYHYFMMIVIAGNMKFIPVYFDGEKEKRLKRIILSKFSNVLGVEQDRFEKLLEEYDSFMSKVNHPSKKTLYAMSKATFYKYRLNPYQQDYFRNLDTPNPIFLKHMDEIMVNFLFDWDSYLEKYKVSD